MLAYFSDPDSASARRPAGPGALRRHPDPRLAADALADGRPSAAAARGAHDRLDVIVGLIWRLGATGSPWPRRPGAGAAAGPDSRRRGSHRRAGTSPARGTSRLRRPADRRLAAADHPGARPWSARRLRVQASTAHRAIPRRRRLRWSSWPPADRRWSVAARCRGRLLTVSRRAVVVVALGALLAWNVGHWPPLTSPDGGWPAAQAAATRLERDAAGSTMALVPLFAAKGHRRLPLPAVPRRLRRSWRRTGPATVVLLCDAFWLSGCGGRPRRLAGHGPGRPRPDPGRPVRGRAGPDPHRLQARAMTAEGLRTRTDRTIRSGERLDWRRAIGPATAIRPAAGSLALRRPHGAPLSDRLGVPVREWALLSPDPGARPPRIGS